MNIMLVSVTERTKEIGVSRALGAKRADILLQFMLEALILAVLGGFIGILIGLGVAHLIALFLKVSSVIIPVWTYIMSFGFSASVGLIFGILPATKAANLNTIDALRFE
jgi:putative ABC transport system permease protein